MRSLLALLLLSTPAIAQGTQLDLNFPREIGAPARKDMGTMTFMIVREPLRDLQLHGGGCQAKANEITIGCSVRNELLQYCTIYIPLEVNEIDALKIEVHERRHCLGQEHVTVYDPDGSQVIKWLP